jgi:Tol biopolymer transport system component/DNA-binding winged helix-turn-helix (wHTH) protein
MLVAEVVDSQRLVRFGSYEVDLPAGELKKCGIKLKLSGQPFQVLAILLEQPGTIVTREELQKRLWPDTFVDIDHNLNTAINKIREVLGDSADSPRFVETLPRRGYRFVAQVESTGAAKTPDELLNSGVAKPAPPSGRALRVSMLMVVCALLAGAGFFIYKRRQVSEPPTQRTLTRITFDDGLQIGATWSPDGRFIAYSSDRDGKFDIWVRQVSGGDAVQITKGPGQNWQPDWSPDGKYIAYRSEEGEGGVYIVPTLGGAAMARRISSFGYFPRWSPDGSQILFQTHFTPIDPINKFYVAHLDGSPPWEVLSEFLAQHKLWPAAAVWHPDGKRVSVWVSDSTPSGAYVANPNPSIWTVPISGGPAIETEVSPAIKNELGNENIGGEHLGDFSFAWAPSGKVLYFESGYMGEPINIWKMTIEPQTLRATAIERLTTGPGPDLGLAVSRDGRRLAFTAQAQRVRNWQFAFDAEKGRVTDKGRAITAEGRTAVIPSLSRDGKHLAFSVFRAGSWELFEKSLVDGHEALIFTHDYRGGAQWSPDGLQLVYTRARSNTAAQRQLMIWSRRTQGEEPLTAPGEAQWYPLDWSSDGASLLVLQNGADNNSEIWQLPVAAAPHAETAARKIAADAKLDLYQAHFSPNGRWIVFEAVANLPTMAESALFVVPAAGGAWRRITDGKHWDDKPRWSPDGKTIYFVSGPGGSFNVWGIRFDPAEGKPVGDAFRVSTFEGHGPTIPRWIPAVELGLTEDKLVINMAEISGGIWVLENVDR